MINNYIYMFWKGNISLWKSYWLVGELLNALFLLLIINLEIYFFNNNQTSASLFFLNFNNFSLLSKIILIFWTVFISIGIWRSAENYKGNIIWIMLSFIVIAYRCYTIRLILFI